MGAINKYRKLAGDTLVFAIGSISSKMMVFLLMPLYTRVLTTADYGVTDMITNTANLLSPFVMLSINEAVIRFCIDHSARRAQVLSAGLLTLGGGFCVFLLGVPVFLHIELLSPYTALIYLYVLLAALKSVVAQFVRGVGLVRLYVADGILATATTIFFNLVLLVGLKMGVAGYVLSIILSNLVSVVFLFVCARLWLFVDFRGPGREVWGAMVRYSVPLIPTTMFWWMTNVAGRYIVTYFAGAAENGLYATAFKVPAILTLFSSVFYQAWQLSAVSEYGGDRAQEFYGEIQRLYSAVLFGAGAGIMLFSPLILKLMVAPAYQGAGQYVPFLLVGEVFSSLVTFQGTFYMAAKRNLMVPVTICAGALVNVGLCFWLVPRFGAMGAAFATLVCYLVVFLARAADLRRMIGLQANLPQVGAAFFLLCLQAYVCIAGVPHGAVWQLLLLVGQAAVFRREVAAVLLRLYEIAAPWLGRRA